MCDSAFTVSEEKISKPSMRRTVQKRVESGTCNVCSAPCSSCNHLRLSCMGSKVDEYSDENCHVTATSQNSVNEDGILPSTNGSYDCLMQHNSEASNLLNVNSSRDALSENVDSKAVEGHGDNMSCVSRANDVSTAASTNNKNIDSKNMSCSSALVSSLGQERFGKALLLAPKSDLLETSSNNADVGSRSPKVQSRCLSSLINGQNSEEDTKIDISKVSSQLCTKFEREPRTNSDHEADRGSKNSNQADESPETQEPGLQSVSGDESDESEIVEHDVKVCDICGDAGREDLLAICSKCSDGAEHTYCMREMLQKVPEGDWLCEECKLAEETENQKQGSDAERTNKLRQASIKRVAETVDAAPASKRQAIETNSASPKSFSPTKPPSLSRDTSFKGLDKGKVKLARQTSFSNHTGFDSAETARSSSISSRLKPSKSALLKSNSFNTVNSKPKMKVVDEVPQKLKARRDIDMEGSARMISKSKSFGYVSSVRSSAGDSKVKMLSPKFSQTQEMKGLKQVKESGAFESKSLLKLDRPLRSSATISSSVSAPKVNQKLTPRGDSAMASSTSNNKESKASQSDSKSGLLRSNSIIVRKGAGNTVTPVRPVEEKLNQVSPKDEPSSSSSWTAERPSSNLDESLQDGSSRSRESSIQSEKIRESSDNRSKPATSAGQKNLPCHKCRETEHTADFCAVCSPRASNISNSRCVKDEMGKGSKLKAAIEAAILKKPGIFRKNKESNRSDRLSSSTMDAVSEMASNDQLSFSNKTRNMVTDEGASEGETNLGTYSLEKSTHITNNNMKQVNVHSGEPINPSKDEDHGSTIKSAHAFVAAPFPKMIAIPEHEFIWQGAIEIQRGGRVFDLCGGIQAHLSTCASPKVLEVVNQFPHKITLDEVPRLSTWPRQFHDSGPKECNIALYFFAKDLESYEKGYKNLLDNMIRRDLALKGSFDGIDFLIFSSTQLPENAQRWNMLFFLWGVFRGRRSSCPNSLKNSATPSSNAKPLDICVPDKSNTTFTGDIDSKVSSFESNLVKQHERLDPIPSSKSATGNVIFTSELRSSGVSREESIRPDYKPETKNPPSIEATETSTVSKSRQMYTDASGVAEDSSYIKAIHTTDNDEGAQKRVVRMEVDRDVAIIEQNLNNHSISLEPETSSGKELEIKQQLNNRKRPLLDLEKPVFDDTSDCAMGSDELADGACLNKKLKIGSSEKSGPSSQLCDLGSGSGMHSGSSVAIVEDVGSSERYFFPMPWKEYSLKDERVPNLELALGAETKPQPKEIAPLFAEKNNETREDAKEKEEESLSLSLSFPFPDKEQNTKPEQRHHVNTSLLLFRGVPDK